MLQKSNDFECLCPASDSDASTRSPDLVHIATMPPQILVPRAADMGDTRDMHFKSPGFTPPTATKISSTTKEAHNQWLGQGLTLVKETVNGKFNLVGAVRKRRSQDEWCVRLSPDGADGVEGVWVLWQDEEVVLNEEGGQYEVVFGWLGGTFSAAKGDWFAKPTKGVVDANGDLTGVEVLAWRRGSQARGTTQTMTVEAFLEKFPPQPVQAGPAWKAVRIRAPMTA